jgi:beta-ureidopropionase / N-carbamoyl-L-amino-acid hydrolase
VSPRVGGEIGQHIDGARLWGRLMELAQCGATAKGGVSRLALSAEEIAARAQLVRWGREIGLTPFNDAAGNLFLRLAGRDPALAPVLVGSHIDSQPTGGKFDGAYGVLSALEAVTALVDSGRRPLRSIEVVAWMNEEGSRFAPGMMGSAVFAGVRRLADIEAVRDRSGVAVREALAGVLAAESDIPGRPAGFPVAAFLEAHIEQGVTLERAGDAIGIVLGIQGKRTFRVEVIGEESHAGTTPRAARRDALVSAVDIVRALETTIWDEADTVRLTIGSFTVLPNAPSVVPGRVTFSIDLRHDTADAVARLGDLVAPLCEQHRGRCQVVVTELLRDEPVVFPPDLRARLAAAAARVGASYRELPSPAGHDARYLSRVCPTAMIFIPCEGGISHNERENIQPVHAELGACVLAEAMAELAELH